MQPFDVLMLATEHLNPLTLFMALFYLTAALIILAALGRLYTWLKPMNRNQSPCQRQDLIASTVREHVDACNDFDAEVTAWENAALNAKRML